ANPPFEIVATEGVSDAHAAVLVTSCTLPSLYVPVAPNCCVRPAATEGFAGVNAIDTSTGVVNPEAVYAALNGTPSESLTAVVTRILYTVEAVSEVAGWTVYWLPKEDAGPADILTQVLNPSAETCKLPLQLVPAVFTVRLEGVIARLNCTRIDELNGTEVLPSAGDTLDTESAAFVVKPVEDVKVVPRLLPVLSFAAVVTRILYVVLPARAEAGK